MRTDYLSKLITAPWNLSKLRARTIIGSIVAAVLRNDRPKQDIFGDALPKMEVVGNVALIPLTGVIAMNVPDYFKELGLNLTDANDVEEEIAGALSNGSVELIVFDVDSPGGLSIAGDKLFDVIEQANKEKPCFA